MTDRDSTDKTMQSVFVLQHLHIRPNGEEDVKLVGVYRSVEAARSAVERLRIHPGFRDHPRIVDPKKDTDEQGFHIGTYPLDRDHWSEGYVTE
jgi:hypothetical protein